MAGISNPPLVDARNPYLPPGYSAPSPSGANTSLMSNRYANNPYDVNSADPSERARALSYQTAVDKSLIDNAGKPTLPPYGSALENGHLKDIYKIGANDIGMPNINQEGLNAIRERALGTGPSPWLNLQLQQSQQNEARNLDTSNAQNAGNAAAARSALAMHGGLSGGGAMQLAKAQLMGGNAAAQGVRSAGTQERMGLNIADEAQRANLLNALPGLEIANAQPGIDVAKFNAGQDTNAQRYNASAAIQDLLGKNAYDSNAYGEAVKAWAAGKTADAQANSGGKK